MSQSVAPAEQSIPSCNIAFASDLATMEIALETLLNGGLVAIPTETVYGLGAAMNNEVAIHKIFTVKGRPQDHPPDRAYCKYRSVGNRRS